MTDLVVASTGGAAALGVVDENPFDVVFRPAQPVLDVVVEMREPLAWLDSRRRQRSFPKKEVFRVVPTDADLVQARELFRQAENEPAPRAWADIAVALLADSMPPAHRVGDAWVCAITDSAYSDPEIWGSYLPGFSFGVIARSIREARRSDGLPTPGAFLDMCTRHRRLFKQWRADVLALICIRFDAVNGECPF